VKPLETVAIVGVGLIGGSIGLALRQRGLANRIVGIGRREISLRKAEKAAAVDRTTTSIAEGVADADLIVVCTPVANIVDHVRQIFAHCRAGALITDAGSTKQQIVDSLSDLAEGKAEFIGSHPLAGSEKTGVEHARAELFVDRVTIVTPSDRSSRQAIQRLTGFWRALGSVVRPRPTTRPWE
jgi:prephenate dehydrogenase